MPENTETWTLRGAVEGSAPHRVSTITVRPRAQEVPDWRRVVPGPVEFTGTVTVRRVAPKMQPVVLAAKKSDEEAKASDALPDFLQGYPMLDRVVDFQDRYNIKVSPSHIESRVTVPVALSHPRYSRLIVPGRWLNH